jgi:hypothetical protein
MNRFQSWRGSIGLFGLWACMGCAGADEGDGTTGQAVEPCAPDAVMPCSPAAMPSAGVSGEQGTSMAPSTVVPTPMPTMATPPSDGSTSMGMAMNDQGMLDEMMPAQPTPGDDMTPEEEVPEGEGDEVPFRPLPSPLLEVEPTLLIRHECTHVGRKRTEL